MTNLASASDASLQRALIAAACATGRVENVSTQAEATIYRVNCTGSSHRRIVLICGKHSCRSGAVDAPASE